MSFLVILKSKFSTCCIIYDKKQKNYFFRCRQVLKYSDFEKDFMGITTLKQESNKLYVNVVQFILCAYIVHYTKYNVQCTFNNFIHVSTIFTNTRTFFMSTIYRTVLDYILQYLRNKEWSAQLTD